VDHGLAKRRLAFAWYGWLRSLRAGRLIAQNRSRHYVMACGNQSTRLAQSRAQSFLPSTDTIAAPLVARSPSRMMIRLP
jgi:hypothetical protein